MDYTPGRNLLVVSKIVNGYLASTGSGITAMSNTYRECTSDWIPVEGFDEITIHTTVPGIPSGGQTWIGYAFYTSNSLSSVIDSRHAKYGSTGATDVSFEGVSIPSNAKYLRVSYRRYTDGYCKVEFGPVATSWSPAPEDAPNEPTWNYSILARNSASLSHIRDISAVYRFYKLQSSTMSPPAKPTTADIPPSGWSMTEPSYTAGSTNSLYSVELTIFTDDTFSYSEVSLSSSYEAAKQAYNKATATQNALDDYINPIASKTYTGLIGTENTFAGANFFFGKIHPTSYSSSWRVKARVSVLEPEAYSQVIDIEFGGYGSTFASYDSIISRTGSVGVYYVELFRATQTGITNNVGHMIGISLHNGTNPANASYKRAIKVDILAVYGCEVALNDTAVAYTAMDGYNTTNYGSGTNNLTQMTVATQGQNATNNANTIASYGGYIKAGTNGIKQYALAMRTGADTWESFTTNHGTGTAKTKNTNGFYPDRLLYNTSGSNIASGSGVSCYEAVSFDFRYSSNCGSTLVAGKPVYIVGTVENDLFYLDSTWWTQTEPTFEDEKSYIYVGIAGNTTTVHLVASHPIYRFYDGKFITEEEISRLIADKALSTADGKNAVFYQTSAPSTSGRKTNDIWFDTDDGNKMYYFNGSSWAERQFGQNAIAADSIYARHIVSGAITAAKISVDNLAAISANLGAITGGSLNIGNGTFTVSTAGALKATSADVSGKITANGGQIADWIIVKNDANRGTSAQGGHIYNTSLYSHSSNASSNYEYEVGLKNDGGVGTLAFYVKRIDLGAAWTGANATDIFYIRTDGKVYCANLEVNNTNFKVNSTELSFGDFTSLKYMQVTKDNLFVLNGTSASTITGTKISVDTGNNWAEITSSKVKLSATGLGVASGSLRNDNDNFGLYDEQHTKWMLYADDEGIMHIPMETLVGGRATHSANIRLTNNHYLYEGLSGDETYIPIIGISSSNNLWVGPTSTANLPAKIILGNTVDKIYVFNASGGTTLIKTAVSDRRLKHDICDLSSSREFIMGLRAKKFKMNGEEGDRYHFGFVAQDVRPLLESTVGDGVLIEYNPEDVDTEFYDKDDERTFSYSMDYTQFIAPMISVIQEQERTIRALSDELTDIREMLAVLIDRG